MEIGEEYYFNDNDKYYKVVDFYVSIIDLPDEIRIVRVQECKLKYDSFELIARDPEHSKEYDRFKVYELIPIGRKKKFYRKCFGIECFSGKYVYKIVE